MLNNYLVGSQFIWRELIVISFKNSNLQQYLWQNLIIIYQMQIVNIIAPLQRIFALYPDSLFLQGL